MAPHQDLTASHSSSLERSLLTNSLLGSLAPSQQVKDGILDALKQVVGLSIISERIMDLSQGECLKWIRIRGHYCHDYLKPFHQ